MMCLSALLLGGCNLWESYYHPDHGSSRADRLCHPYGDCVQGKWVSANGAGKDPMETHSACVALVAAEQGNDWTRNSVTQGLEISECMEQQGFTLKQ
ncbi:MAG: hypothetical protein MRJ67_19150 [Nitrospirales bacterium]|nr:hypothetical protein [Nitrospirales bacterium]